MILVIWILVGVIFFLLTWEFFFILPTKWLKVERVEWEGQTNKKILQISDLHIRHMRISLANIKALIHAEKPDYIFLTGDYIDQSEKEFETLKPFLQLIEESGVETYAVLGNHDRDIDDVKGLEDLINQHGIHLLKNEFVEKDDAVIVGVDDHAQGYHDPEKSFSFLGDDKKDVLVLTHDPDVLLEVKHPFTMLVCGHLHGKQVNIPYFFKIKNMGQLAKQGIYKGKHDHEHGPFYISKGVGQSRWNIRFFVRSEVTIHTLRSIKKHS